MFIILYNVYNTIYIFLDFHRHHLSLFGPVTRRDQTSSLPENKAVVLTTSQADLNLFFFKKNETLKSNNKTQNKNTHETQKKKNTEPSSLPTSTSNLPSPSLQGALESSLATAVGPASVSILARCIFGYNFGEEPAGKGRHLGRIPELDRALVRSAIALEVVGVQPVSSFHFFGYCNHILLV